MISYKAKLYLLQSAVIKNGLVLQNLDAKSCKASATVSSCGNGISDSWESLITNFLKGNSCENGIGIGNSRESVFQKKFNSILAKIGQILAHITLGPPKLWPKFTFKSIKELNLIPKNLKIRIRITDSDSIFT